MFSARYMDFAIIGWLITSLSNDPSSVGLLIFLRFIPLTTSGLISGWLVDKFPRLKIIKTIIVITSIYYFLLSYYLLIGSETIEIFYILTFISGILSSIDLASRQSYLSNLVRRKTLKFSLAIDIILMNLCIFLGPNIGMLFYEIIDFYQIYFYLGIVTLLNLLIIRKNPNLSMLKNKKEEYSGFAKGVGFAIKNKLILSTLLILAFGNFFAFSFESMAPYVGKNILNSSPQEFSFLLSMQGLGALSGAILFFPLIVKINRPGLVFAISSISLCIFSFLFSFENSYFMTCVIIFFGGLSIAIFGNMHTRILISQTPNPLRGRIQGLRQLSIGFFPLGSLFLGLSGDYFGISDSIRLFSFTGVLITIFILILFRELRVKIFNK
tara:strand:- start:23430 stop:24575 length:1146 start_codon:yes stop_codon:yes gene_type:complete